MTIAYTPSVALVNPADGYVSSSPEANSPIHCEFIHRRSARLLVVCK